MSDTIGARVPPPTGDRALDAYSQVVTEVAAELTLRVAALQMSRRRRDGRVEGSAGSAVVFTDDGFLLTNAHVVGSNSSGTATFADGTTTPFRVIGADPLSDLAVVRAEGPDAASGQARRRVRPARRPARCCGRQSARTRGKCHRGRGERARPFAADAIRRDPAHHRRRHPDRRRPQSRKLRRRARQLVERSRGHQHRGRRHRTWPRRPDQRHDSTHHRFAPHRRPRAPRLPRRRRHSGTAPSRSGRTNGTGDRVFASWRSRPTGLRPEPAFTMVTSSSPPRANPSRPRKRW